MEAVLQTVIAGKQTFESRHSLMCALCVFTFSSGQRKMNIHKVFYSNQQTLNLYKAKYFMLSRFYLFSSSKKGVSAYNLSDCAPVVET